MTQRNGRGQANKRDNDVNQKNKPVTPPTATTPIAILQRGTKPEVKVTNNQETTTTQSGVQLHPAPVLGGYKTISREEGIAAGNAILGMLGQTAPPLTQETKTTTVPLLVPTTSQARSRTNSSPTQISKEQLKQTLISLLDEPQFFDQIYHAYVNRVQTRS